MNAGKLIAQIAVLAIVVYCCYGAIVTSLPTSADEINQLKENPFEIDAPTFSGGCDGMNFNMNVTGGKVISHLPAAVADVYITLYVGSGPLKMDLGSVNIGTLIPGEEYPIEGAVSAPIYALLAYATVTESEDGSMALPLCMKIGFKYFEWKGTYLVDLAITVKNTIPFEGMTPEITVSGDDAKVSIKVDSTEGGIIKDAAASMKTEYPEYFDTVGSVSTATIKCGDAEFKISIDNGSTDPVITFLADGDGGKTAVDLLKESVKEDGTLDLVLLGVGGAPDKTDIPPLTKENVDVFIEVIQTMYNMGAAP